jgi:hypothetical protein
LGSDDAVEKDSIITAAGFSHGSGMGVGQGA